MNTNKKNVQVVFYHPKTNELVVDGNFSSLEEANEYIRNEMAGEDHEFARLLETRINNAPQPMTSLKRWENFQRLKEHFQKIFKKLI